MKVYIKDQEQYQTLAIADSDKGDNLALDYITQAEAIIKGQFTCDEEHQAYLCEAAAFDWWEEHFEEVKNAWERIAQLKKSYPGLVDKIDTAIDTVSNAEYEFYPKRLNQSLDDFEREYIQ